ncbi:importin-5-like protein isoform X2 [Tanacetum coccineum]
MLNVEVRDGSAIWLRNLIKNLLAEVTQNQVKDTLLIRVEIEDDVNVRISLCHTLAKAFIVFDVENWGPELSDQSPNVGTRLEMLLEQLIGKPLVIVLKTSLKVKHILLSRVVTEDDGNVRISLCRTIANAFTVFGGENGWPELSVFINQCVEVDNDLLKETAMLILANLLEQSTNVATRDESTFILEMLLGLLIHKPLDDRTKNLVKQTLLRSVEREDDRNTYIEAAKIVVKQGHAPDDITFVGRAGLFEAAMHMINNMELIRYKWLNGMILEQSLETKKIPGCTSIEVDGIGHEFLANVP